MLGPRGGQPRRQRRCRQARVAGRQIEREGDQRDRHQDRGEHAKPGAGARLGVRLGIGGEQPPLDLAEGERVLRLADAVLRPIARELVELGTMQRNGGGPPSARPARADERESDRRQSGRGQEHEEAPQHDCLSPRPYSSSSASRAFSASLSGCTRG